MARSVVLNKTLRCDRCLHPPRWCICDGLHPIDLPFAVDVLVHHREALRPTSTGHLIKRVVADSGRHDFGSGRPPGAAEIVRPAHTIWVLHPAGELLPPGPLPPDLQVLLIDGSWRQAGVMMRAVQGWGRKVALPMAGESRYWLRSQQDGARFSTVEALLFLLEAFGFKREHEQLRLQFELHVYAGLCTRGNKELIANFLATSPLREAMPGLLARLAERRPAV